ncbi:MAG TPA: hypothetical protein VHJ17_13800, partial [Thermomonospora sp.]|nr:hypothetical protein [Thermomonospora sp.]
AGAAGAGAAGAGAVGAAGSGVAGSGVLAGVGAKVALGVAGAAVVAGAGGVAVNVTRDGTPPPRVRPVAAVVAVQNQTYAGIPMVVRDARYARVTGLRDRRIEERVNRALREPLDATIAWILDGTRRLRGQCTRPSRVGSTVRTGTHGGGALVSAVYRIDGDYCWQANGVLPSWSMTVDTRDGRKLTATEVFLPSTLTPDGIRVLWSRLTPTEPDVFADGGCLDGQLPKRSDFFPYRIAGEAGPWQQQPPVATPFFGADRFELNWSAGGSDCVYDRLVAPYGKVRDLLRPEIAALLPRA